jgi:hypothetical protein
MRDLHVSHTLGCVGLSCWKTKSLGNVYYYPINRELNRRLINECRCDERIKGKTEGSTYLV